MNTIENQLPVSVVIIALNEQVNIERAIRSAGWAEEILVYDSGSIDDTKSIALNLGAKVIAGHWEGFGKTKKKASSLARFDWILSLDSDEQVTEELKEELFSCFKKLNPKVAYSLTRRSYYLGRWIGYGGWFPDRQIRLFNKKFSNWNEALVHEKIQADHYEKLQSGLNHFVFKNISHQILTNNKYSSLQAEEMIKSGVKFSWFKFLTKPVYKFFECYFFKRGFLDGFAGYVIAVNAAHSVFMKWCKLKEMQDNK